MQIHLTESHENTLRLLSSNRLTNPLPEAFYSNLGENWGGPSEVKRTVEKFISINPLEIYYISPQVFLEVNEGILQQRLINNVKTHVSNRAGLLLFSHEMQPLDLEEINNEDNPQNPEFDAMFFSAISNYDYWRIAWEATEKEIEEDFSDPEMEKRAGTLCLVPVSNGFVNIVSSHLSTNNELYLDDYAWNDRESYGNIMDFTLLFSYLLDMNAIKGRNEFFHDNNKIITFL